MTPDRRRFLVGLVLLVMASRARAGGLETITGGEAEQALRQSLEKGARTALVRLGKENGYFADPRVKIVLPRKFSKADRILRALGQGEQVDDLILAMNRAAEAAASRARDLVVDAVERMAVADAKAILSGGDDAATAYFRKATEAQLAEALLPVVRSVADTSGLARSYHVLSARLVSLAGIKSELSTVEKYVNEKALDGMYVLISEEERAIRADPGQHSGSLLGKVFGSLK
jgi:hypothetical protein